MLKRRDFLKLAALAPLAYAGAHWLGPQRQAGAGAPNIIVLVMDAFSARHVGWLGYPRPTMPKLAQLAEKAIVYHRHFSGGSFTSPGTASLLTGVLPWQHRAMHFGEGVESEWYRKSLFHAFDGYHRIAGTHNILANNLLRQFEDDLEGYISPPELYGWDDPLVNPVFGRDILSSSAMRTLYFRKPFGRSASLFLSTWFQREMQKQRLELNTAYRGKFPLGLPEVDTLNHFRLEDVFKLMFNIIEEAPKPYLGYFHLYPPHDPYRPPRPFLDRYRNDGYVPPVKPEHLFTQGVQAANLYQWGRLYDEYLDYVDDEIFKFYNMLAARGLLNNTIFLLTSDHGEMFERGFFGHFHRSMHLPVMNIPLMIFMPGQSSRVDILSPTSAIDVLPTLTTLAGMPMPEWAEGNLLRPFSQSPVDLSRPIFTVDSKESTRGGAMASFSISLVRWPFKLIWYRGFPELAGQDLYELYDIERDPEEMNDLVNDEAVVFGEMSALLSDELRKSDSGYPIR